MNDRLSKADWIAHGLRTLAREGASGLKVDPLAKSLNVSRGSFYWHFRDLADFRSQVLQGWQERATEQIVRDLAGKSAPDRLKHLLRRAFGARNPLDLAVRAWATHDPEVAAIVAAEDGRRIAYIAGLLVTAGVDPQSADSRAAFVYWAYLGRTMIRDAAHASIDATEMDAISALLEQA